MYASVCVRVVKSTYTGPFILKLDEFRVWSLLGKTNPNITKKIPETENKSDETLLRIYPVSSFINWRIQWKDGWGKKVYYNMLMFIYTYNVNPIRKFVVNHKIGRLCFDWGWGGRKLWWSITVLTRDQTRGVWTDSCNLNIGKEAAMIVMLSDSGEYTMMGQV